MKTYRIINLIEVVLGIIFFLYFAACVIYAGLKINIIYVWVLMGAVLIPELITTAILCIPAYPLVKLCVIPMKARSRFSF